MRPAPISADCITSYRAAHDSGKRDVNLVRWIVLHSTEGGTAESIARYFASQQATGSAHLVVDDNACYRCLPNDVIPWSAPRANTRGFHIEQCGFAHWTTAEWAQHPKMLERAAYKTARHCILFGIPVVWRTAADLKAGRAGVTDHRTCTAAFGGSHSDPGAGWPRRFFMARVSHYFEEAINAGL